MARRRPAPPHKLGGAPLGMGSTRSACRGANFGARSARARSARTQETSDPSVSLLPFGRPFHVRRDRGGGHLDDLAAAVVAGTVARSVAGGASPCPHRATRTRR